MTAKRYTRGIWWVKRDFRLRDNEALCSAIEQCESILPLFVIEPDLCASEETSFFHYHAWQQAASYLAQQLSGFGVNLWIQRGHPAEIFDYLHEKDGFDALFSHEETGSNITFQRDLAVKHWCLAHDIQWHEYAQNGVVRALRNRAERQVIIRQRLIETTPIAAPQRMHQWQPDSLQNLELWPEFESISGQPTDKRIEKQLIQPVSEAAAEHTLQSFMRRRAARYSGGISSPNTAFTAGSRLSAHLAWGTISLRQVFHSTWHRDQELARQTDTTSIQWRKSLKAFRSRLHWHDHFIQRLESSPAMEFKAINPAYRSVGYAHNDVLLEAWKSGQTGIPLVDACVRCLAATGFLNFRMRAMVLSCGCYGFAQSWQSLQYPLARLFLDYEPGIHFSQVQMQAGIVGINTIRVYNPHKQLLDHDPHALFVKKWIPELREFSSIAIADYNDRDLGDYPTPVSDIKNNSRVILDQIYAIRNSADGKVASQQVLEQHGSRLSGRKRPQRKKPAQGIDAKKTKTRIGREKATVPENQLGFDFGDE